MAWGRKRKKIWKGKIKTGNLRLAEKKEILKSIVVEKAGEAGREFMLKPKMKS